MPFQIPDTPDEFLRQTRKGLSGFNRGIPFLVLAALALGALFSSFYSVEPDEVGIIRRFGKYVKTTDPGLHWKIPLGIERLDKVKVERIFKEEFGFRTVQPGTRTRYSQDSFDVESLMLTGDVNVLEVTWVVQFKIKDPVKFLFNLRNPRETVRALSEAVMRQVIGDSSVSEALTTRRLEINQEVQKRLQTILESYDAGIYIQTVKLQDVNPPDAVKPSFNEVNQAKQEMEKVINQAWEAYNKVIPRARGEAEKTIQQSQGYALRRVNQAEGDASRFTQIWTAYAESQDVTRRRMYLEALSEALPKAGQIFVMDASGQNLLPLLRLNEGKTNE